MEDETKMYGDAALEEDAEIRRDFDSRPLPEGDYPFEVVRCDMRDFEADDKAGTPACRGAWVTLKVSADGGRARYIRTKIRFLLSLEPKIAAFLRSVGLKKMGEPTSLTKFPECLGKEGRCHLYVSQDGRANNLGYFLDPDAPEDDGGSEDPIFFDESEMPEDEVKEMHEWFGDM